MTSHHNHFLRSSSKPIEIPRRQPALSSCPIPTPTRQSARSSDILLFDMSPDFSSTQHLSSEPETNAIKSPKMYHFPTFSPSRREAQLENRQPPASSVMSAPRTVALLFGTTGANKISTTMVAKTKINGFDPLNAPLPSPSNRQRKPSGHVRRTQRLSPPPRSSSYSSSPWILLGDGGLDDEDVTSEDLKFRALEFETYLLQRIDDPSSRGITAKSFRRSGTYHDFDLKRGHY